MEKAEYDQLVKRLKEANKVVTDLDPVIREAGWELLRPYVEGNHKPSTGVGRKGKDDAASDADNARKPEPLNENDLLDKFASEHDAQSNALLVTAILYGTYGTGPFAPRELTDLGNDHRLPMPLMGNFLRRTKRNEKKMFRNGRDGWMITTDGAKWLSDTYGVKRGTKQRPE